MDISAQFQEIFAKEVINHPKNQMKKYIHRFVLQHLLGKITIAEIEEMITTVDKNQDGKISYSEFRVRYKDIIS